MNSKFLFISGSPTLWWNALFLFQTEIPKTLENIARNRPTVQSSTEHEYYTKGDYAVDGKRDKCSQTQWGSDPWWRVDLGKDVWVEKVLIVNTKHEMLNLDIRIGKFFLFLNHPLTEYINSWMTDRLIDWPTYRLTEWLCDWLTDLTTDWVIVWLTERPIDWLISSRYGFALTKRSPLETSTLDDLVTVIKLPTQLIYPNICLADSDLPRLSLGRSWNGWVVNWLLIKSASICIRVCVSTVKLWSPVKGI